MKKSLNCYSIFYWLNKNETFLYRQTIANFSFEYWLFVLSMDRGGRCRSGTAQARLVFRHQKLSGRNGRQTDPSIDAGNLPRLVSSGQWGRDLVTELCHHVRLPNVGPSTSTRPTFNGLLQCSKRSRWRHRDCYLTTLRWGSHLRVNPRVGLG